MNLNELRKVLHEAINRFVEKPPTNTFEIEYLKVLIRHADQLEMSDEPCVVHVKDLIT